MASVLPTVPLVLIVGAYLCLSGAGLIRKGESDRFLSSLAESPAAMHGVGAVATFSGLAILTLHWRWDTPAAIAVNVVAAIWLFEGAGMLADPTRLRAMFHRPSAAAALRTIHFAWLITGIALVVSGLSAAFAA